jgi:hypothetical protein
VIAPYNAQVADLAAELPEGARVGTVDKFQGQEAPLVIFSLTTSTQQDAPRGMDFLFDPNRFNVATSRAHVRVHRGRQPALFEPDCQTPKQMKLGERVLPVPRGGARGDAAAVSRSHAPGNSWLPGRGWSRRSTGRFSLGRSLTDPRGLPAVPVPADLLAPTRSFLLPDSFIPAEEVRHETPHEFARTALLLVLARAAASSCCPPSPPPTSRAPTRCWSRGASHPRRAAQVVGTTRSGAQFALFRPDHWQGDLVLYAHGLRAPVRADPPAADRRLSATSCCRRASRWRTRALPRTGSRSATGSARPSGSRSVRRAARTAARVFLIGTSMGGVIAVALAERHPDAMRACSR